MYNQEKKYYLNSFLLAFLMSVIIFLPFVIYDGGYFVYHGDYNAQQIPFYKLCIDNIHNGNFGWNWETGMGVNFIGSYGFYTLGSPFFWLAALFPASISQYLMAPLMCLKIALSSFFAFVYIRRFVKKPQSALIGGLLYAFSGFSLYNLVFNHFHEAICFFPLLLLALEEAVVNKRRGVFALTVALNALVNYFFFFGECVFLVIYFVIRLLYCKEFRISVGDFFSLAFESVVGVAISAILFVPSIYSVLSMGRTSEILNGFDFLIFNNIQWYGSILEAMFSAEGIANKHVSFVESETGWSSLAMYLPLFSMAGVITFVRSRKKNWIRTLLLVCLLMLCVPCLNALFSMLNVELYARWLYMPILLMCLATVSVLEDTQADFSFGVKASWLMTLLVFAVPLLLPIYNSKRLYDEQGNEYVKEYVIPKVMKYGLSAFQIVMILLTVLLLAALTMLIKSRKKLKPDEFLERATMFTLVGCLAVFYVNMGFARTYGPLPGVVNTFMDAELEFEEDVSEDFFRVETIYPIHNYPLYWGMSSQQCFHSIVPETTHELQELLNGIHKVYSGRPYSDYAFNALTSTRYFILDEMAMMSKFFVQEMEEELQTFTEVDKQGKFYILKNNYALPMGYAYDSYVLRGDVEQIEVNVKDEDGDTHYDGQISNIMVRSVVLTNEQANRLDGIVTKLPEGDIDDRSLERFEQDAQSRIEMGVDDFIIDGSSVTVKTSYDTDRVVVLSMAYDEGWSAEIGGEEIRVEPMNVGFLGFVVPAGEQEIHLTYTTPGLKLGVIITVTGVAALAVYLVLIYSVLKHRPRSFYHETIKEGGTVGLHSSYIERLSHIADISHRDEKNADDENASE